MNKLRPPKDTYHITYYNKKYYLSEDIDAWLDSAVPVESNTGKAYFKEKLDQTNFRAFVINEQPIKKQTLQERAIALLRQKYEYGDSYELDENIEKLLKEVDGGE